MPDDGFVRSDMLRIKEYDLMGKIPDPFLSLSGQRLTDPSQWPARREEIKKTACGLLYGARPPEPEFLEVETLNNYRITCSYVYKVTTGTRERPLSFRLRILMPQGVQGKRPVIVDGDDCFIRSQGYYEAALSRGVAWALFDRMEIACDHQAAGRGHGSIYRTYPGLDCGALSCWAWGYSRAIDALEQIDLPIDLDWIAATGHSRGGKAALLAGAMEERIRVVNSNDSGAGGSGCYRLRVKSVYEDGTEGRVEELRDSLEQFSYWYGKDLAPFAEDIPKLPFDLHFIKALVAPRTLFISEGAGDHWCNPVGSWQTTMAAREVYRFLGAEDKLFWYYRPGHHGHLAVDVQMLVNVLKHQRDGEALDEKMFRLPFEAPDLAFDWRCPDHSISER